MPSEKQKKKIAVIGEDEFTTGFKLAGIQEIYGKESYSQKIQELIQRNDLGIIVAAQEDLDELSQRVRKKVEKSVDPVVVPLSETGTTEQINEKIQKVIGADTT